MEQKQIRLHGMLKDSLGNRTDLFIFDFGEGEGAPIATQEQYDNLENGVAYCNESGAVWQYHTVIGHINDIECV